MYALTSNRKRGEDCLLSQLASSPRSVDQSYGHISKKPKLLESASEIPKIFTQASPSKSIASRISEYPESKGSTRQVHAPVRNSKFGSFLSAEKDTSEGGNSADRMGWFNRFYMRYKKMKREAFQSFRYISKEDKVSGKKDKKKEVILIDGEEETRDDALHRAWVEEVEIVGNEQRDVGSSWVRNIEIVAKEVQSLDTSVATEVSNECGKVIEEPHDLSLPVYKRLICSSKRREGKLERLKNDIVITELSARRLKSLRPQKKVEQLKKDFAEECFAPLSQEEENEVSRALSNSNRRKVLVSHKNSGFDITGEKLRCLKPGAWLNDEVINLYLELLKERETRESEKFLKCHFFNTFFYKRLIGGTGGYNFQSVRRWTTDRKLGYSLLECDKIFVPIHQEIHWCLAIINKKDEKFQYLDSLRGVDSEVLNVLARYFVDEVKDKCGKGIDVSSWEQEIVEDLPEQENGFDCGMFMVKYADFFSRDIGLCFSQEHMPYFRKRTAKEILKLRAE